MENDKSLQEASEASRSKIPKPDDKLETVLSLVLPSKDEFNELW